MKRYSIGVFKGAPAMFEQPDGLYVKWEDVRSVLRHLARPDSGWTLNLALHAIRAAAMSAGLPDPSLEASEAGHAAQPNQQKDPS
jgi:hypothetical protein